MPHSTTRRRFLTGLGFVAGTSLLAACGGAASGAVTSAASSVAATVKATTASATATSQSAASASAAAITTSAAATVASAASTTTAAPSSAAAGSGAAVTLQYLGQGSPEELKIYNTLASDFHSANPGITINVGFTPPDKGGAAGILQVLTTQVAAGTGPDVYWTHSYIGSALYKKGISLVLNPYIDQDKTLKLDDYFTASYMDYTFDGKHNALPREIATDILFYRTDIFDKAGVKYPDQNWTWDDLRQTAKALTSGTGGSEIFGYSGPVNSNFLYTSMSLENGSDIIDAQKLQSLFNTSTVEDAIQFFVDMRFQDKSAPTDDQTKADKTIGFATGRAAMAFSGYYTISTIKGDTKRTWNYDVSNMPLTKAGGTRVSSSATSAHSAWSGTKHADESWQWLKFLSGEQASKMYGASGLVIPPLKALANSPDFTSSAEEPHHRKVFIDDLTNAHPFPIVPNWIDVLSAINDMLAPAFAGTKTAKEAIDAGNDKVNALLKQNG